MLLVWIRGRGIKIHVSPSLIYGLVFMIWPV